ncbi:AraC family transcriptional regulator [Reinekea marinisedimentorum]|uniref:AraC-like DNA-binding protein n=1 Tax=Reinekea marinisedimentorum TaxID=230495 RepID=A0A4R3HZQ3_9GAMM|nr:AraC family transcriptional regulator [Reinekea marinisedimentorum]TCS38742.1 AraC-like DNA-binding protein [Reinekea marinisedimentorum]
MQYSVLNSWPRLIVRILEQKGINAVTLLNRLAISPDALEDPNARIRTIDVLKLWHLAAEACGEQLPLLIAKNVNASTFHALGFAMATSATGYSAIKLFARYYPIMTTSMHIQLMETDDRVGLRISASELVNVLKDRNDFQQVSLAIQQMREAGVLGLIAVCRNLFGVHFSAERLKLSRSLGDMFGPYQAFVQCELTDGTQFDEIWLNKAQLMKPLPSSNPQLAKVNEQILKSYINMMRSDIGSLVVSEIIRQLPDGGITQTSVAEQLNLSSRTLQRRLAERKLSFRKLLNDTRRELALQYIQHENIPVLEISYRLGFSEPANFTRAFRQWTGASPATYRLQQSAVANQG